MRSETATITLLQIPLQELVKCLPSALQRQLAIKVRGGEMLRLQAALPSPPQPDTPIQITFGDLRKAALPGTFRTSTEHDHRVITIPPNLVQAALERSQALKPRGRKNPGPVEQPLPKPPPSIPLPTAEKNTRSELAGNKAQNPRGTAVTQAPAANVQAPVAKTQPAAPKSGLEVPCEAILSAWPENLKRALASGEMGSRAFFFPLDRVEAGLKAGVFKVRWAELRQWLHPPVPALARAIPDAIELDISLEVVGHSFVTKAMKRPSPQRVNIQEDIPDIFAVPPQSPAANESVASGRLAPPLENAASALAVSNASTTRTSVLSPPVPETAVAAPGIDVATVAEPACASPKEILQKLCRAPGIAGALLATADGLLVAAELPRQADDPQTIAAFAPQIYRQVAESVVRMHLGQALAASFTLMNQEWRVYKADTVFLLIVMNAGHLPPTRELQAALNACAQHARC